MKLTNVDAIRAQGALARLMELDLPIRASLDTAIISNMVDVQVKAYQTVLGNVYKKYSIKAEPQENGTIQFVCTAEGENEEATRKVRTENLEAFIEKLNDLLEANTADMQFKKIQLPTEVDGKPLQVKPEILKSLVEFVEVI